MLNMLLFTDAVAMASEKELHRISLSDIQLREHLHRSPVPRRARSARVSRSVDRESRTRTGYGYSSSNLYVETLPKSLLRRRLSLSAISTGTDRDTGDTYLTDLYGIPPKTASQVQWSRKDVLYTAENMGFSRQPAPKHTEYTCTRYRDASNVDSNQLRSRAHFVDEYGYVNSHAERRRRIKLRASSVPHMDHTTITPGHIVGDGPIVGLHRRARSVARVYSAGVDGRPPYSYKSYAAEAAIRTEHNNGFDIASFVLAPGEQFIPTNVSVSVLPSGKKAVTYTRFSQKGTGDQHQANVEVDHVIQRTNRLQVIFEISNNSKAFNRHVLRICIQRVEYPKHVYPPHTR